MCPFCNAVVSLHCGSLFWVFNSTLAEVCHLRILHFLLVKFILNPQQQLEELGQLGC